MAEEAPEIIIVDRPFSLREAEALIEAHEESLRRLGKADDFEVLPPLWHSTGGRSGYYEVRLRDLKVVAERKRKEAEAREARKAETRRKMSEARKGRPRPKGAGRQAVVYAVMGERHTVPEWAEILDIPAGVLYQRLNNGWPIVEVFTTPVRSYRKSS